MLEIFHFDKFVYNKHMENSGKILVICGPTSTGKTDLGIYLAQKFNGEIISADSRQVYKNMTIGTGKKYSDEVKIWGYDLVSPNEEFSVSHFYKFAIKKIQEIYNRHKLPIIVGGTGLYINSVIRGIGTVDIPINNKLRKRLEVKSASQLFEILNKVNLEKASLMNESDRKNPRRLIRAIEVSTSNKNENIDSFSFDVLQIGLTSQLTYLYERISNSVNSRINEGFEKEVLSLRHVLKDSKALTATGYLEFSSYLNGHISKEEAISIWERREKQYIKRQLTWFNKQPNICWFDISDRDYKEKVVHLVNSWNNNSNAKKN